MLLIMLLIRIKLKISISLAYKKYCANVISIVIILNAYTFVKKF